MILVEVVFSIRTEVGPKSKKFAVKINATLQLSKWTWYNSALVLYIVGQSPTEKVQAFVEAMKKANIGEDRSEVEFDWPETEYSNSPGSRAGE